MSLDRFQSQGIQFIAFPPAMLSLYSDVINGARAVPHDVAEALRNSGAEAVLDGPMFEKCDPSLPYSEQNCGTVDYRHYDLSGVDIPSKYPGRGITISVMPDGSTQAGDGSAVPPGARVSVQLYPALVVNGQPAQVTDNGSASRAALVVMRDGRMAFAAGPSMLLSDFAQALAESGALYAGYTDGGGSTSLASTGFYTGSSEHRKVLTWLLAKAPQPGKTTGVSSQVVGSLAIAAVIVAVGAIAWNIAKTKHTPGYNRARRNPNVRHRPQLEHTFTAYGHTPSRVSLKVGRHLYRMLPTGSPDTVQLYRLGATDDDYESYTLVIKNGRIDPRNSVTDSGHEITSLSLPTYMIADEMYAALVGG